MTDEAPGEESGDESVRDDDRAARLAALLSVTIGSERDPEQDDAAASIARRSSRSDTGSQGRADESAPVEVLRGDVDRPGRTVGRGSWAMLVVLVLVGSGLAYAGSRVLRSSTTGVVLAPVVDPAEPGYEALVDASPTIVVQHDVDGELDSLTVLSLATPEGAGGGGVLLVPTRTLAELPMLGETTVDSVYDPARPQVQADAVGHLLGVGMEESALVSDDRWADLVAPVAPIEIDNPNEILSDGAVRFEAGEIELEPEDVGPYLRATVEGESDLARLFRHETFWVAWLDAVGADGSDAAVPGELDSGIGRFVRALARSEHEVETLPVETVVPDGGANDGEDDEEPAPVFSPRSAQMQALVDRLVPLPLSPAPGIRARVRILNGTTDIAEAADVAGRLPPAGVSVTIVGNAPRLDVEETTIEYAGEDFADEAEAIAEILGVGRVVEDTRPSDAVDITVTLGADHD